MRSGIAIEIVEKARRLSSIESNLVEKLSTFIESLTREYTPNDEELLDLCEHVAMIWSIEDRRWHDFAKYILLMCIYREAGKEFTVPRDAEQILSYQALVLLYSRYLLRNEQGYVTETPTEAFKRVAYYVALAEARYGKDPKHFGDTYYELLSSLRFLSDSPTLMNAGSSRPQLAARYVLSIENDLENDNGGS